MVNRSPYRARIRDGLNPDKRGFWEGDYGGFYGVDNVDPGVRFFRTGREIFPEKSLGNFPKIFFRKFLNKGWLKKLKHYHIVRLKKITICSGGRE